MALVQLSVVEQRLDAVRAVLAGARDEARAGGYDPAVPVSPRSSGNSAVGSCGGER